MKSIIKILFLLILSTIFIIIFIRFTEDRKDLNYLTNHKCGEYSENKLKLNNSVIKVLISDNDCKRELGLSSVISLKNDEGMLFEFNNIGFYPFWMKDMNFPIDILWIDENFKIVGIEKEVAPNTYPKTFGQNYLSKYVLEISAGNSDKNNIKIGDKIIFLQK